MQLLAVGEALNRGDLTAGCGGREGQARVDPAAVNEHRAGPALAVVTPLLGAGQIKVLPQQVEQRCTNVDLEPEALAVDGQLEKGHCCDT